MILFDFFILIYVQGTLIPLKNINLSLEKLFFIKFKIIKYYK
jgi:hypothetical protein